MERPIHIQNFNDQVIDNLKFISDPFDPEVFLKLKPDLPFNDIQFFEHSTLEKPSDLFKYFKDAKIIQPDRILRPNGDTTFFTTAGVQHVETIINEKGKLTKELFMVAQPVIRSQFMDKVKNGTSTSFINFSVEYPYATISEFTQLTNNLIKLIVNQGINPQQLKFQIENSSDKWGSRHFDKSFITIYIDGVELGESVYIHNYPLAKDEHISIADVSFGLERLNWAINNKPYFADFSNFYTNENDSNHITSIIDCIRTSVLIAGDGVRPSHKDPGYRLRQLLKRFVSRTQNMNVNTVDIIRKSYQFWKKWDASSILNEEETIEIITSEIERSYNSILLLRLGEKGGPKIDINVNQSTVDFFKQVDHLPKVIKKMIYEIK